MGRSSDVEHDPEMPVAEAVAAMRADWRKRERRRKAEGRIDHHAAAAERAAKEGPKAPPKPAHTGWQNKYRDMKGVATLESIGPYRVVPGFRNYIATREAVYLLISGDRCKLCKPHRCGQEARVAVRVDGASKYSKITAARVIAKAWGDPEPVGPTAIPWDEIVRGTSRRSLEPKTGNPKRSRAKLP